MASELTCRAAHVGAPPATTPNAAMLLANTPRHFVRSKDRLERCWTRKRRMRVRETSEMQREVNRSPLVAEVEGSLSGVQMVSHDPSGLI